MILFWSNSAKMCRRRSYSRATCHYARPPALMTKTITFHPGPVPNVSIAVIKIEGNYNNRIHIIDFISRLKEYLNSNFTILYLLLCSKVAEASVTLQITVQWISRQLQVPVFGIVRSCPVFRDLSTVVLKQNVH